MKGVKECARCARVRAPHRSRGVHGVPTLKGWHTPAYTRARGGVYAVKRGHTLLNAPTALHLTLACQSPTNQRRPPDHEAEDQQPRAGAVLPGAGGVPAAIIHLASADEPEIVLSSDRTYGPDHRRLDRVKAKWLNDPDVGDTPGFINWSQGGGRHVAVVRG